MSENEGLDLSKVVNLIMENPHLIEEISKLAKSGTASEEKAEASEETAPEQPPPPSATYVSGDTVGSRRSELLSAMKPYLSKERAKAIDSMITIADILGMMKGR